MSAGAGRAVSVLHSNEIVRLVVLGSHYLRRGATFAISLFRRYQVIKRKLNKLSYPTHGYVEELRPGQHSRRSPNRFAHIATGRRDERGDSAWKIH